MVNPKIVRACTVVLGDWEHLSNQIIKSAVTLLHRIAFGCKMPVMLFQVKIQQRKAQIDRDFFSNQKYLKQKKH